MIVIKVPGIEGGPERDVLLKRHTLKYANVNPPISFDAFDFDSSNTIDFAQQEFNELSLLHELDRNSFDGTIVDVGANIGIYTILAKKLYPNATVVSVEPVGDTHAVLRENLRLNGLYEHACVQCAVGGIEGLQLLSWHTANPGGASALHSGTEMEVVTVRRLPTVFSEMGVTSADLVKLDVEGMEYGILYGLTDAEWSRIKRLSVEMHGVLSMPRQINQIIYDALSEFLAKVSQRHHVEIELRWPHDYEPALTGSARMYWRPETFSFRFPARWSR